MMLKRMSQRPDRQSSYGTTTSPVVKPASLATPDKPLPNPTTNLNSGEFSISSRPAFGTRATGDVLKGLPDLPFDHLELTPATPRASAVPTASSVYSQPSYDSDSDMTSTTSQQHMPAPFHAEDVSPPDSPGENGTGNAHSRKPSYNVSPISTENHSPFSSRSSPLKSPKYNSNLPVPRKNTKKFWKLPDKTNVHSPDNDSTTVRWDEYSGEPTDSDRGKPPSTTPGAVKLHEDPTPGKLNPHNFGISTQITGGAIARKRVGSREVSDAPVKQRPEWKGAGGRHAIVRMPSDKPLPDGQSPTWNPGQIKKQQMEDQQRAQEELRERQRVEREQAEEARWAKERRSRQIAEEERLESERQAAQMAEQERLDAEHEEQRRQEADQMAYRRQMEERAEQIRLDKERDEQERRKRERVVQARRERDLAQQEERRRHDMARKAGQVGEDAEAAQRTQETAQQMGDMNLAGKSSPRPGHPAIRLDTNNLHTSQRSVPDEREASSAPISTSELPKQRNDSLGPEDKRSPLARNPSREEINQRNQQPLPDLPENISPASVAAVPASKQAQPQWEPRTSSLSQDQSTAQDPAILRDRSPSNIQDTPLPDGPNSRFSATTVASTAYNHSPPQTPMAGTDISAASASSTPDSILNRKRPVAPAGYGRVTARKPIPSEITTDAQEHVRSDTASKMLPKAPEGVPKVSQVQTLQAKQDALRRRRRNIETVIRELTDVVQPSSLAYDQASRAEIKKTVDQLNRELAEVVKDEHETGIKLHRAWKRHDDFADFEPTSIWVRRVTH